MGSLLFGKLPGQAPEVSNAVKYNAYGATAGFQTTHEVQGHPAFTDMSLFMLDLGRSSEDAGG